MKNEIKTVVIAVIMIFSTFNAYSQTKWYQDSDADTWGDPNVFQISSTQPTGYVQNNLDCNDNRKNDSKWHYVDTPAFSNSSSVADVSLAKDKNDVFYVAFYDNATKKGSVMKYNGSKWVYVGTPNFTTGDAEYISIALDNNGVPYVSYQDKPYGYQATVKKFDGTNWVTVGSPGFSAGLGRIYYATIKFSSNNVPHVMYTEYVSGQSWITVRKFNGTNWVPLDADRFLKASAYYQSFTIDNNDIPYIITREYDNKATVMKYSGTKWDTVGKRAFSSGGVYNMSITTDINGTPYVSYTATDLLNRVVVQKFDGTNWQVVGNPGFTNGNIEYTTVLVDRAGVPYVSYDDNGAYVRKYNGANWQLVGNSWFSKGWSRYLMMVFDSLDRPYVAYEDYQKGGKVSVMRLGPDSLGVPDTPIVSASKIMITQGDTTVLSVDTGILNDASSWVWYTSSCGGAKVTPMTTNADGSQITVAPTQTTTYYVRGEGQCVANGVCDNVTITVPVSVVDREISKPFKLYPNPAITYVELYGIKSAATVNIYDVIGRTMLTTTINNTNNTTIDVSTLPHGCYVVELSYLNGIKHKTQLIKQ